MFARKLYRVLLWVQGVYTALTSLWGQLNIDSIMAVTGPKTDVWLFKTVSVVLLAIGFTLISHALVRAHPLPALVPDGLTRTKGFNRRIMLTTLTICGKVWGVYC
jgi:hypothetical protein